MDIDIYCKNGKCPICNVEMENMKDNRTLICKNGCYCLYLNYNLITILGARTFCDYCNLNHDLSCHNCYHSFIVKYEDGINKMLYKIKYWKENDRFITEILER